MTSGDAGEDLGPRLEREGLLRIESATFRLTEPERALAGEERDASRAKNISYHPQTGGIDGVDADPGRIETLRGLMARYAAWSRALVDERLPAYAARLEVGRTSLRLRAVEAEPRSWRKDDRRLHVDAFTSQPVGGRRILRVFSNIDPAGRPRRWAVGEAFEDHARRFRGRLRRRLLPGEAALLEGLRLTKARRTHYDQLMLGLHDAAKRDEVYQTSAPRRILDFPAGATWVVFTDQTPHAALSGRGAMEQTFYLPVQALHDQAASPLRILERLEGATLA
ncbi:MAG: Kdo hydroxylase family protein [Caulobacteraceae bacterium]|nr:Kdo hydroxylase family protein [Caulobacteraceae bacterium]